MDATQFVGRVDNEKCKILIHKSNSKSIESRTVRQEETAFCIKYLSIYFTNGYALPPILIVARDEMDADEFMFEVVPLLSHDACPTAFGYLVWTKTRAGNQKLFEWVFKEIVYKEVKKIRATCGLDPSEDDYEFRSAAIFFMDGEQIQIRASTSPTTLAATKESSVFMLKHCASCSLIHQLCDVSCIYRNSKADFAVIEPPDYQDNALQVHLKAAIDRRKEVLDYTGSEISKLVRICQKIVYCLRKHVTVQNIQSAARKCGMLGCEESWTMINRRIPFNLSTYNMTAIEFRNITEHWDALTECMRKYGNIPDAAMDQMGICRGDFDAYKEDLVEYRWRVTHLNHVNILTILEERQREKEETEKQQAESRAAKELMQQTKLVTDPLREKAVSDLATLKELKKEVQALAEATRANDILARKNRSRSTDDAFSARNSAQQFHRI
jgi:hypothetical protein